MSASMRSHAPVRLSVGGGEPGRQSSNVPPGPPLIVISPTPSARNAHVPGLMPKKVDPNVVKGAVQSNGPLVNGISALALQPLFGGSSIEPPTTVVHGEAVGGFVLSHRIVPTSAVPVRWSDAPCTSAGVPGSWNVAVRPGHAGAHG